MKNLIYLITLKPSSHRTAEENLGIQYLASMLMLKGYQVEIRDAWLDNSIDDKKIEAEIISKKEDILFVGTSSYMLNNKITCEFIKRLKSFDINVVCGGFGPTFEPDIFLKSGADAVIVSEGELTILDIANHFKNPKKFSLENIDGIVFYKNNILLKTKMRTVIKNLDEIPYPQRPYLSLVLKRHSTVNVLTSRGCMGSCTFCSISAFQCQQKSLRWRARTIENIVPELIDLYQKQVRCVKFVDDSFIENERDDIWCEKFCEAVKKNNLKMNFRASIRADKVSKNNIKFLKRAGFFSFSCGIENGSETALKRMAKLASIEDNKKALNIFKKYKIYVQAGFILFDDMTNLQELKENYKFLKHYNWIVSKGIFSEMYAAVGTVFTKNVGSSSDKFYSNNLYQVKDASSRKIYEILKNWQLHHSKIYDMVIDPISAPKAIEPKKMKKILQIND